MALQGDHRVVLIDRALPDVVPWMGVDIGQNTQSLLAAVLPQGRMAHSMKRDGASFVGIRVEIVIANEGSHPVSNAVPRSQQKSSAFVASPSPAAQFKDQASPEDYLLAII